MPSVINFSASLCASFALCHDVEIDSCSMRDVTRLRRSALRWAESLLKWRYLVRPPAIVAVCGGVSFYVWFGGRRLLVYRAGVRTTTSVSYRAKDYRYMRRGCVDSTPSQGMDIYLGEAKVQTRASRKSAAVPFGKVAPDSDRRHINNITKLTTHKARSHSPCRRV